MKDKSKQKKLQRNTAKLFQLIDDNQLEKIKQLIKAGVDLAIIDKDSQKTPIEYAARKKQWNCVIAIANAQRENRKGLYRYGVALHHAVKNDQYDAAKSLIAANAHLDYHYPSTGEKLLHLAVRHGSEQMLTLLMDADCHKYSLNAAEQNPFELACDLSKWEYATLLLKQMPEYRVSDYKNAGLYLTKAICAGQSEIAELLIKLGTTINTPRPKDNYTSLHTAVVAPPARSEEMIRFVIERGGDQTALTKTGRTPIALASLLGTWDAVQLLVELDKKHKGNSKRIAALQYETVLLNAIKAGNYAIVKLMLEHGAPFQRSDSEKGNIALYWAVKKNEANPEIVSLLLQRGADPTIKTKNGQTILDLAKEWGHVACLERLQFNGFTANDVSQKALIWMTADLIRGMKRHDKDLVDVCRQYAQNIFQALNDNAIPDEDIRFAIHCLDECYSEIFKAILIRLNAKRDELKKSYSTQLVYYHEYAYDPAFEINQLSALITFINTVLRSPRQDPPVKLLEHQHYIEAQLAQQFVQTQKMVRDYHTRVRNCLSELNDKIKNNEWQVYKFGMWVKGMPKHMQDIQKILNLCLQSNNDRELLRLFLIVRSILTNLQTLPHRHPDVTAFYHEAADKIANMGFVTAENLLVTQSVKPAMGFWSDVTALDHAANALLTNASHVTAERLLTTQKVKPAMDFWVPASAPPMTAQTIASSTDLTDEMTLPESNETTDQLAPVNALVLTLPVDDEPPTYDEHMKLKRKTAAERGLPPMDYSYLSDPNYQKIYPSVTGTTLPVAMDAQTKAIETFNQPESVQAMEVEEASFVIPENVMADSTLVAEKASELSIQQFDEEKMRGLDALTQDETWEVMFGTFDAQVLEETNTLMMKEKDGEIQEKTADQMQKEKDEKKQEEDAKLLEEALSNLPALPTHKPVARVSQSDLYRKPIQKQTVPPTAEVKTRRMVADC